MPFESQAQRKFMYAKHPEIAKRWQAHTPAGKKLPEHVADKDKAATKEAADRTAFVTRFLGLCKAAGVTDPDRVAALADRLAAELTAKQAALEGGTLAGHAAGFLGLGPLLGSVVLPAAVGGAGGLALAGARNWADTDDEELLRIKAQSNLYRRKADQARLNAQVRQVTAADPSKYVVLS